MKKILSFVLVLAMVLGSVSMVFATDYPDVKDTDSCAEAVNVLSSLGVIEGYNDGTFKPEKTITRAEAIKIVVAALGLPVTEGNSYPTQFTDVPATAWYSGYVRYGVALGITEGTSKEHFSPDATVTYDQVITFIMRALGYSDKLVGGYPTGYIMQAYQLGVLDADSNTGNAGAPRGEIAQDLYRALNADFVYYSKDTDSFMAYDNLLHKTSDNCYTMYERLGAKADTANPDVVTPTMVADNTLVDLSEYLGAKVEFVKEFDSKTGLFKTPEKIVGVSKVLSEFVTGYKAADKKLGGYDVSTATDDPATGIVLINNGTATKGASTLNNNDTYAVILKNGKIDKIVSQQSWTINAANQIAQTDLDDINLKDEDETGAHTLFGYNFAKNDDKPATIKTSAVILEGVKGLDEIKKGDVVYVYDNGTNIAKIQVGQEVVEGELTKISSDEKEFTIGGTVYKLAGTTGAVAATALKPLLGKTVKANLDINGKIYAAAEVEGETTDVYGVILAGEAAVGKSGDLKYEAAIINVFKADGAAQKYTVADDVNYTKNQYQGQLVQLTLDDKDVVTKITAAPKSAAGKAVTKSGVVDGDKLLSDSSVVISYTGTAATDISNAKKYAVVAYTKLCGETPTTNDYFEKSGKVTYALVTGLKGTSSDTYAVVTEYSFGSKTADVKTYVNGAAKSYTADNDKVDGFFASAGATLFKLTASESGKISAAAAQTPAKSYTLSTRSAAGTEKTVKIEGGYVTVAEDVVVYIYDKTNKTWSAKTGVDALVGLKVGNIVDFFDTDSAAEGYEIAVVTK